MKLPNPREYFRSKGCDYWDEQQPAYGSLRLYDSVTIVGYECGTTAYFLLQRGVKRIIGFESDPRLLEIAKEVARELGFLDKVELYGEWNGQPTDTDTLIMDCEGCEEFLRPEVLLRYKSWCVAFHVWSPFALNRIMALRPYINPRKTYTTPDGRETVYCFP